MIRHREIGLEARISRSHLFQDNRVSGSPASVCSAQQDAVDVTRRDRRTRVLRDLPCGVTVSDGRRVCSRDPITLIRGLAERNPRKARQVFAHTARDPKLEEDTSDPKPILAPGARHRKFTIAYHCLFVSELAPKPLQRVHFPRLRLYIHHVHGDEHCRHHVDNSLCPWSCKQVVESNQQCK